MNIETIRYYERIGLVPAPMRSAGGHRLYDEDASTRLSFVKRARELGFSLPEIRSLIGLEETAPTCADVYALATSHIQSIRKRINDLQALEQRLATLAANCSRSENTECPIIDALGGAYE